MIFLYHVKSDQKDNRKRDPRHFSKIVTAGPSPMSFGNRMDAILDTEQEEDISHISDPKKRLFRQQQVAGEQGSEPGSNPSQSGGSCSEQRGNSLSYVEKQMPKKINTGILRTSLDSVTLRRNSQVSFQGRMKRTNTGYHGRKNNENKFGYNDPKNASVLSALSRVTSNNSYSYSVKTQTGETPQNLLGKLPAMQQYSLFESIDRVEKMKQRAQRQQQMQQMTVSQDKPFESSYHQRMHSPVLEQQTLEQYENTYSSTSPPPTQQKQPSNRAPNAMKMEHGLQRELVLHSIDQNNPDAMRYLNSVKHISQEGSANALSDLFKRRAG